jgi:F-box associated protein
MNAPTSLSCKSLASPKNNGINMDEFSANSASILDLADEILLLILDYCPPDALIPFALACKRFHKVTSSLISLHKDCLSRLQDPSLPRVPTEHTVIDDPFEVIEWLLKAPPKAQIWLLRYFRRVFIKDTSYATAKARAIIENLERASPGSYQALIRAGHSLRNFQGKEDVQNYPVYIPQGEDDDSDSEDIDPYGNLYSCRPYRHFYEASLLSLMLELESLIIQQGHWWLENYGFFMSTMVEIRPTTPIFDNLRGLYIFCADRSAYQNILRLLSLPKVKTLMLDGFNHIAPEHPKPDAAYYQTDRKFALEHLILLRAQWLSTDGKLWPQIPSLRSFVLEDETFVPEGNDTDDDSIYVMNRESYEPMPNTRHSITEAKINEAHLSSCPPINKNTVQGAKSNEEDLDDSDSELDWNCTTGDNLWWNGYYLPGMDETKLFRPKLILDELLVTHANTLQHLAITINRGHFATMIQRRFKVLHFRDFRSLTYLEFDSRILRPIRGDRALLPKLADILPSTIQTVVFSMTLPFSDVLTRLLSFTSTTQIKLPCLRRILIRSELSDIEDPTEIEDLLRSFKEEYASINITLEWEDVHIDYGINPKMLWDDELEEIAKLRHISID